MPSNVSMPPMLPLRAPLTSPLTVRTGAQFQSALPYPANARTDRSPPGDLRVGTVDEQEMAIAVERLNGLAQMTRHELQFKVDDVTGRTVIKIIDAESKEVIRQIPPEEVMALLAHLQEFGSGLLNEQA